MDARHGIIFSADKGRKREEGTGDEMAISEDEWAANRDKRPLYAIGTRVRVTQQGSHYDWRGTVRSVKAYQTIGGFVKTYMYDIAMDNLAVLGFVEESIAPE